MTTPFVSRFTPSLMTAETLETLFIQREKLAAQVLDDIRHDATGKGKHYTLLIASRGLGKTHFVSVIHGRVMADPALHERLRVAWLREEERGVASFLELLARILQALVRQYEDAELADRLQQLYDLPRAESERAAAELLVEYLDGRTLLLLVENLDALFLGLKAAGQQALRAFLQERACCSILATATSLFNGVSRQTSPFYGFFRLHHLDELTLDEATDLLARIAELRKDAELAGYIRTPDGRARIRAVHHLAGGNHRVYVVFSEFLTKEALDELVTPFMRMLDDLTPYYQSRLDLLSAQQQQIVNILTRAGGALPVKEIARQGFMSQQTAANQLKDLLEKGYLRGNTSQRDKRETYYELREPLMRLCFEVKEYRKGPIRLFVDFLRFWYREDELLQRLALAPLTAEMERMCVQAALEMLEKEPVHPQVRRCLEDLRRYSEQKNWTEAGKAAEELVAIRGEGMDWGFYGIVLFNAGGKHREALEALDKAIELGVDDGILWTTRGVIILHLQLEKDDNPFDPYNQTLALSSSHTALETFLKTGILVLRHRCTDAINSFKHALILLDGGDSPNNIVYSEKIHELLPSLEQFNLLSEKWEADWQRIAGHRAEFKEPLAMLAAGIAYLNSGDDRPLLALPLEQRKLVEEMLVKPPAADAV